MPSPWSRRCNRDRHPQRIRRDPADRRSRRLRARTCDRRPARSWFEKADQRQADQSQFQPLDRECRRHPDSLYSTDPWSSVIWPSRGPAASASPRWQIVSARGSKERSFWTTPTIRFSRISTAAGRAPHLEPALLHARAPSSTDTAPQSDLFSQTTVCDYLFRRDKIYAYLNLDDDELFVYRTTCWRRSVAAP